MSANHLSQTENDREVFVQAHDLPLFCPRKSSSLQEMHPRVFLDVARTGTVSCPYCGTNYHLHGLNPQSDH